MFSKTLISLKDRLPLKKDTSNWETHVTEAVNWLYRAQDATPDDGVSHSYLIGKDWAPSYPETTGYIIPTLLNLHALEKTGEARSRALRMAQWEIDIQLPDGSIPALSTGEPVVFDTGQVLFGWISAYQASDEDKFLKAAVKAGNWLVNKFDPSSGTWNRHGNPGSSDPNLYNIRSCWALIGLSRITDDIQYSSVAEKNIQWVLENEAGRGWFNFNCLTDNSQPLLHTIAYTSQGLFEAGLLLKDQRCLDAVIRTSEELIKHLDSTGRMSGRFDSQWRGTVSWSCLTGIAQTSIVWNRIFRLTGDTKYREAALRANRFLKATQDLTINNPGIRGGIKGSYPVNGSYGKYRVLNWAAKFFLDALILEEYPEFDDPLY